MTDELAPISGAASEIARRGGIAPTRFRRFDNDNYFTIDADWIIPALLSKVPIEGRILEPAAGRGHLVHEFRQRGFSVVAIDVCAYEEPLIADIRIADMRAINSLQGFAWAVTNLPYGEQDLLAAHLVALGARDGCGVALLTRAEWIVARARRALVHAHPNFAGVLHLTSRPRWSEVQIASPRHNFAWLVWSASPRQAGVPPWVQFAGKERSSAQAKEPA